MRCPTLTELPPPPPGKTGWPWTEESPQLPDTMPDGSPWPRISIVTPSFNQGQFLEETIRSVLLQGYPDVEYIIIDGGSTDNSVEIIKKYEPWLAYWVSEPDRGQSHAINKGFERSTGEIMAWINSDDMYLERCLSTVALEIPRTKGVLVGAAVEMNGSTGECHYIFKHPTYEQMLFDGRVVPQASTFWRRSLWKMVHQLDERLNYVMDYDLWLRMFPFAEEIKFLPQSLSLLHVHEGQKTQPKNILEISLEKVKVIGFGKGGISPWKYFWLKYRDRLKKKRGIRRFLPNSMDMAVLVVNISEKFAEFLISNYLGIHRNESR